MARRRPEDEAGPIEDVADAKAAAANVRERAARLRSLPGILDGALEEVRSGLERVLREYDKLSRRRLGPFERELESIAKRAKELEDAGRLSPRHAKLIDQTLQHARRVHFWNARRALAKIEKALEPTRDLQKDVDAYRAFHRKTGLRVRGAEESLVKLRAVPKPPASKEGVAGLKSLVEACNRAADEAWSDLTHRPSADALKDLVAHPDVDGLGLLAVQEFAALRELYDLLEADPALKESIGTQRLAELVATSEFSNAKWDRVYPAAVHMRRKLQDLLHHVRPVVGGKYGIAFAPEAPVSVLERRLAAWRRFPGSETSPAWTALAELRASGTIPDVQESARIYDRYGDLAERAWEGDLADEIESQEKELAAAKKTLASLPSPDSLLA